MIKPKFAGIGTVFWIGVVEARDDSKAEDKYKLGRVRVRLIGHHSEQTLEDNQSGEGIPVNKLPWAYPVNPIQSASMSGIGLSPTGVVEGTWVVGFAMDGMAMQDLYYFGTLTGVPTAKTKQSGEGKGFRDPSKKYPLDEFLDESDVNRLARADKTNDTFVQDRKNMTERAVVSAKGTTWAEPETPYNTKYPYNHTHTTESGHIREYDDTSGAERMLWAHKDGTFVEWHPKGDEVHKIIGDQYEITLKDRNMYVKGDINITVNGNANIRSNKSINIEAAKNIDMKATGKITMWAGKGIDMQTTKKVDILGMYGVSVKASSGKISILTPRNIKMVGINGVKIGAISGKATIGSPANSGQYVAKVVA